MKNIYYLGLIFVSIIITIYIVFEIKMLNDNLGLSQNHINQLKLNNGLLEKHLCEKINLEQFNFNPSVELFGNNHDVSSLLNVSEKNLKLVIFYPKEVCNACFGNQLNIIIDFVRNIDEDDFVVISEAENYRKVKKELADNMLLTGVFFVNKIEFLGASSSLSPIIFILDENLVGMNFFPLIKGKDKLLQVYLDNLSEKYFS